MGWFKRESQVECLVREMGWLVMSRENNFYRIRPGGCESNIPIRVTAYEDQGILKVLTELPIRFPLSAATPDLYRTLLLRNNQTWFGKWCMEVAGTCDAVLYLMYTARSDGLTAPDLCEICRCLVDERNAFHADLRRQLANGRLLDIPPARFSVQGETGGRCLPGSDKQGISWLGQ